MKTQTKAKLIVSIILIIIAVGLFISYFLCDYFIDFKSLFKSLLVGGNKSNDGLAIGLIILIGHSVMGFACHNVVTSKGYSDEENDGFALGLFLGILGLIVSCAKPTKNIKQPISAIEDIHVNSSLQYQLDEIIKLKEMGYLTEEEFIQKRKQILNL